MVKSEEQALIDDGGIRLRCSERGKIKCTGCGSTYHSPDDWTSNGNACPECGGSPQHICARCEGLLDAPPLGEHPCHSLDVYRKVKRIIFAEEMIVVKERRERSERAERDLVERDRVERERAERERVERERVERERVEREGRSRSSDTKWKVLAGAFFCLILAMIFAIKDTQDTKPDALKNLQKPQQSALGTRPQQSVETKTLPDAKSLKVEQLSDQGKGGRGTNADPRPSASPSQTQPASGQTDVVRASLSAYPLAEVTPRLGEILDATKSGNEDGVTRGVEAIKQLSHPARGDRKIARAANTLGLAAMEKNAYIDAVSIFASAVRADPADQEIIDNLAGALLKSSRLPEAREAAKAALLLNPMRSSAWANLAMILAGEGKEGSAVASFQLAYRFSRNTDKTREYLLKVSIEEPNTKVAGAALKALTTLGEQQPNASNVNVMEPKAQITNTTSLPGSAGMPCTTNSDCGTGLFCYRISGSCQNTYGVR